MALAASSFTMSAINNMTQIFSGYSATCSIVPTSSQLWSINNKARHELAVADASHSRAVDFSSALATLATRLRSTRGLVDAGAIRLLYRHCDGMVGIRFRMSRQLKQVIALTSSVG